MNCFICGFKLEPFIINKNFKIDRCPNCGLGVTENPHLQKLNYHRDSEYIEEEDLFKNIFLKRINKILEYKKEGSALEIGCSTGLMLSLLKERGWKVLGIEPSKQAAEKARERGVRVLIDKFENISLNSKFDLIIFNHTLEHLEDPSTALKKAFSLLKRGGLLYIDLPNFGSAGLIFFKENWPLLLPSEHLWHFTQKSLEKLLSKFDLRIIYTNTASGVLDLNSPMKEIWVSVKSLKKRFFKNLITFIPSFILTKLKKGSGLTVIAQKDV